MPRVPLARLRRTSVWAALGLWVAAGAWLRAVVPYQPDTADPLFDPWRWTKLAELDGKEPRAMVEGADGAMWFAVADGVLRYDGVEWRGFSAADGLTGKRTTELVRAADGTLYAGTEVGIFRFGGEKWERVFPADPATSLPTLALLCARDGSIWTSVANTIVHLRAGRATLYAHATTAEAERKKNPQMQVIALPPQVPLATRVSALFEDREGQIWCGIAPGNMLRFDPRLPESEGARAWRVFDAKKGFPAGRADHAICQTRDGRIWFGGNAADAGLNVYNPSDDTWSYFNFATIFGTDNIVRSILETSDGTLWVGGHAKLFRLSNGEWQIYRAPDVPTSSSRISMLESRSGDLWFMGAGDDVQRIDYQGRRWLKYEGLNFQCETPDGRQWFLAADNGVVCREGERWWRHGVADGLMESPYALLGTRKGELFAAGTHEGVVTIARLAGDKWTEVHRQRENFAVVLDARAIAETPDGSLWFGAYVNGDGSGLLQYNPAKGALTDDAAWTVHKGTGHDWSFGFATAADGSLFSAAHTGLVRFDGQAWERLDRRPMDALAASRKGEIWAGTRGAGITRFDRKTPQHYTINDGLQSNAITALFFDRDDHLWVGTSRGVSHFDGAEWITDAFSKERLVIAPEGGGFRQGADGAMWLNQFSREWIRRALPGGKLSEGTTRQFWTVRYRRETQSPRTTIVEALERVAQPGNTVISWRGVDPWWRSSESDLQYSYRVDGGAWSRFSAETTHAFLALPTGPHVFEVRARDRDMNVESPPARVAFAVIPPVWQQPWFVGLVGLLTIAILAQSWRVIARDRRLLAEVAERRAIQAELEKKKVSLESEIDERKRMQLEVERVHKELVVASHHAGMAEVATSVLHNIGNVLNSINVSATVAEDKFRQFKATPLDKAATLLETRLADLPAADEKVRMLPRFLNALSEQWTKLQDDGAKELKSLRQNIDHVKEIVAAQQDYARFGGVTERIAVSEIVEHALRMNSDALVRHAVTVVRDFKADAVVEIDKNKALQILINLIRNAKDACVEAARPAKQITVRTRQAAPGRIAIEVSDNGVGIPAENLTRIFNHGFTTKQSGHGFGLHSSANAAKSIGGALSVRSGGPGAGATFVLEFPTVASGGDGAAPPPVR